MLTSAMKRRFSIAMAFRVLLACAPVAAEGYPARTVTVGVPFPAGGSVEGVARIITRQLSETLGRTFLVENRGGGAGGIVGCGHRPLP
jgi:tripartite-type tricarboxylate transporter receptor subunit TctC